MSRLWSPADGVSQGRPPFGVWVGEPEPPAHPPAGPSPRRRRSTVLLVVAGMLATAMVAGTVVAMVDRIGAATPQRPGQVRAPTLAALNAAIARAQSFLDGLYKPLGRAGAVQSEHYGLPIRVRFPDHGRWVLLGQGAGVCGAAECPAATRIDTVESSYGAEAYQLSFATDDVRHLRSFRYTVRHATQLAWLYAVNQDDTDRAGALARFMLAAGFVPGRDLRAAIFGR